MFIRENFIKNNIHDIFHMILNNELIRAKKSIAKSKLSTPSGTNEVRISMGQRQVEKMVPMVPIVRDLRETSLADWKLLISGDVENPVTLNYADLEKLGIEDFTFDIHCVTSWSKLDQSFR